MKKKVILLVMLLVILFCSLLISCSKNEREEELSTVPTTLVISTPTTPPNTMPYAVFFDDQLYFYDSNYILSEEDLSELRLLGEITNSVTPDKLPTYNFETNIGCKLPTPLFGFYNDTTKLVMEMNTKTSFDSQQRHEYFLFIVDVNE